jgi:alpha-ketoglutarate-dependent taurine dioxygenase
MHAAYCLKLILFLLLFDKVFGVLCEDADSCPAMSSPYKLIPLKLGAEVFGFDLKGQISDALKTQIRDDVHKHRILIFRNQGHVEGNKHVEIAKWFGELDSEPFYKHPKSPSYDVFRVSNDGNEGCRGVGRTGWHIDGSFRREPYGYSVYHMAAVPHTGGETRFVGLKEIVERLSPEERERWESYWMISDRRMGLTHPLVYKHPITTLPTICFHLGMTDGFVVKKGSSDERVMSSAEAITLLKDIHSKIVANNEELVYAHKWQEGDFIISDNLAVGHEAAPTSQDDPEKSGLRILHRVTVAGIYKPSDFK